MTSQKSHTTRPLASEHSVYPLIQFTTYIYINIANNPNISHMDRRHDRKKLK